MPNHQRKTRDAAVHSRKGFTLTEMIVVLVIIVILIALLVPTLTGYIDKAKEKSVMAEGQRVLTATRTILAEHYGNEEDVSVSTFRINDPLKDTDLAKEIVALAEMKTDSLAELEIEKNQIESLIYQSGNKAAFYYAPGHVPEGENEGWTVKNGEFIR
ncbi:prepilin-type N-terminal cleavage/methylation domain-containing protein [Diplocloster hominis]|uniref:prepilin-type N-terminal cleavage/methylation domain-containing protein n=1 Tax=Diplocloster hominis TaxID=3079010 RepID=UPI0031BBB945